MYKAKRHTLDSLVKVIDDVAITTTATVYSAVVDARGYDARTVFLVSSLDKNVSATLQGCIDEVFTHSAGIGAAVAVTSASPATAVRNDYYPYIRLMVTNADEPTTGSLNGWVMMKV